MTYIRRRLLDLLVRGSFPDQIYRVGREVIKNKVDFYSFSIQYGSNFGRYMGHVAFG